MWHYNGSIFSLVACDLILSAFLWTENCSASILSFCHWQALVTRSASSRHVVSPSPHAPSVCAKKGAWGCFFVLTGSIWQQGSKDNDYWEKERERESICGIARAAGFLQALCCVDDEFGGSSVIVLQIWWRYNIHIKVLFMRHLS